MINLSKPFGALICTIQLAVFTFTVAFLGIFTQEAWFRILLVVLLFGVVLGSTQFFDRILTFTDRGRALWISFTPLLASAVVWGYYNSLLRMNAFSLIDLNNQAAGGAALLQTFSTIPLWFFVLLQIAIPCAALFLIFPAVRADQKRAWWLALPVVSAAIGWFIGRSVLGGLIGS